MSAKRTSSGGKTSKKDKDETNATTSSITPSYLHLTSTTDINSMISNYSNSNHSIQTSKPTTTSTTPAYINQSSSLLPHPSTLSRSAASTLATASIRQDKLSSSKYHHTSSNPSHPTTGSINLSNPHTQTAKLSAINLDTKQRHLSASIPHFSATSTTAPLFNLHHNQYATTAHRKPSLYASTRISKAAAKARFVEPSTTAHTPRTQSSVFNTSRNRVPYQPPRNPATDDPNHNTASQASLWPEYAGKFQVLFDGKTQLLGEGAYSKVFKGVVDGGNEYTKAFGLKKGDLVALKRIPFEKANSDMRGHEVNVLKLLIKKQTESAAQSNTQNQSHSRDSVHVPPSPFSAPSAFSNNQRHLPGYSDRHSREPDAKHAQSSSYHAASHPPRPPHEFIESQYFFDTLPFVSHFLGKIETTNTLTIILSYCPHDNFKGFFANMLVMDIRRYMWALLSALDYIHQRGIIHRDIKPGNFLYKVGSSHATLVDFGLAQYEQKYIDRFRDKLHKKEGELAKLYPNEVQVNIFGQSSSNAPSSSQYSSSYNGLGGTSYNLALSHGQSSQFSTQPHSTSTTYLTHRSSNTSLSMGRPSLNIRTGIQRYSDNPPSVDTGSAGTTNGAGKLDKTGKTPKDDKGNSQDQIYCLTYSHLIRTHSTVHNPHTMVKNGQEGDDGAYVDETGATWAHDAKFCDELENQDESPIGSKWSEPYGKPAHFPETDGNLQVPGRHNDKLGQSSHSTNFSKQLQRYTPQVPLGANPKDSGNGTGGKGKGSQLFLFKCDQRLTQSEYFQLGYKIVNPHAVHDQLIYTTPNPDIIYRLKYTSIPQLPRDLPASDFPTFIKNAETAAEQPNVNTGPPQQPVNLDYQTSQPTPFSLFQTLDSFTVTEIPPSERQSSTSSSSTVSATLNSKYSISEPILPHLLDEPVLVSIEFRDRRLEGVDRAGTKGFRAPEILLKSPLPQTTKIDIWSAGCILLSMLTRRYPVFTSPDDYGSCAEIMRFFGWREINIENVTVAKLPADFPISQHFSSAIYSLSGTKWPPVLLDLLAKCMDPNPSTRYSAAQALSHPFFKQDVRFYDCYLFGDLLPLHISHLSPPIINPLTDEPFTKAELYNLKYKAIINYYNTPPLKAILRTAHKKRLLYARLAHNSYANRMDGYNAEIDWVGTQNEQTGQNDERKGQPNQIRPHQIDEKKGNQGQGGFQHSLNQTPVGKAETASQIPSSQPSSQPRVRNKDVVFIDVSWGDADVQDGTGGARAKLDFGETDADIPARAINSMMNDAMFTDTGPNPPDTLSKTPNEQWSEITNNSHKFALSNDPLFTHRNRNRIGSTCWSTSLVELVGGDQLSLGAQNNPNSTQLAQLYPDLPTNLRILAWKDDQHRAALDSAATPVPDNNPAIDPAQTATSNNQPPTDFINQNNLFFKLVPLFRYSLNTIRRDFQLLFQMFRNSSVGNQDEGANSSPQPQLAPVTQSSKYPIKAVIKKAPKAKAKSAKSPQKPNSSRNTRRRARMMIQSEDESEIEVLEQINEVCQDQLRNDSDLFSSNHVTPMQTSDDEQPQSRKGRSNKASINTTKLNNSRDQFTASGEDDQTQNRPTPPTQPFPSQPLLFYPIAHYLKPLREFSMYFHSLFNPHAISPPIDSQSAFPHPHTLQTQSHSNKSTTTSNDHAVNPASPDHIIQHPNQVFKSSRYLQMIHNTLPPSQSSASQQSSTHPSTSNLNPALSHYIAQTLYHISNIDPNYLRTLETRGFKDVAKREYTLQSVQKMILCSMQYQTMMSKLIYNNLHPVDQNLLPTVVTPGDANIEPDTLRGSALDLTSAQDAQTENWRSSRPSSQHQNHADHNNSLDSATANAVYAEQAKRGYKSSQEKMGRYNTVYRLCKKAMSLDIFRMQETHSNFAHVLETFIAAQLRGMKDQDRLNTVAKEQRAATNMATNADLQLLREHVQQYNNQNDVNDGSRAGKRTREQFADQPRVDELQGDDMLLSDPLEERFPAKTGHHQSQAIQSAPHTEDDQAVLDALGMIKSTKSKRGSITSLSSPKSNKLSSSSSSSPSLSSLSSRGKNKPTLPLSQDFPVTNSNHTITMADSMSLDQTKEDPNTTNTQCGTIAIVHLDINQHEKISTHLTPVALSSTPVSLSKSKRDTGQQSQPTSNFPHHQSQSAPRVAKSSQTPILSPKSHPNPPTDLKLTPTDSIKTDRAGRMSNNATTSININLNLGATFCTSTPILASKATHTQDNPPQLPPSSQFTPQGSQHHGCTTVSASDRFTPRNALSTTPSNVNHLPTSTRQSLISTPSSQINSQLTGDIHHLAKHSGSDTPLRSQQVLASALTSTTGLISDFSDSQNIRLQIQHDSANPNDNDHEPDLHEMSDTENKMGDFHHNETNMNDGSSVCNSNSSQDSTSAINRRLSSGRSSSISTSSQTTSDRNKASTQASRNTQSNPRSQQCTNSTQGDNNGGESKHMVSAANRQRRSLPHSTAPSTSTQPFAGLSPHLSNHSPLTSSDDALDNCSLEITANNRNPNHHHRNIIDNRNEFHSESIQDQFTRVISVINQGNQLSYHDDVISGDIEKLLKKQLASVIRHRMDDFDYELCSNDDGHHHDVQQFTPISHHYDGSEQPQSSPQAGMDDSLSEVEPLQDGPLDIESPKPIEAVDANIVTDRIDQIGSNFDDAGYSNTLTGDISESITSDTPAKGRSSGFQLSQAPPATTTIINVPTTSSNTHLDTVELDDTQNRSKRGRPKKLPLTPSLTPTLLNHTTLNNRTDDLTSKEPSLPAPRGRPRRKELPQQPLVVPQIPPRRTPRCESRSYSITRSQSKLNQSDLD